MWQDAEDGGFGGTFSWQTIQRVQTQFLVAAQINGWSKFVIPQLNNPWLELAVLFETQHLEVDFEPEEGLTPIIYISSLGPALWELMILMSQTFKESGIYLTDELDDGRPWETLIGAETALWAFDLAFIPNQLSHYYAPVPNTHKKLVFPEGTGFLRIDRWRVSPW